MTRNYHKISDDFKCRLCKESVYEYPNASECESCEYAGTKLVVCVNENCKLYLNFHCRSMCKSNIYCSEYIFKNQTKQLIHPTSYISPLEIQEELKTFLISIPFKHINVVFDLLLCNGNNFNRFISASFDYINFGDFEILKDLEEIQLLKELSAKFYSTHPELLENSILSKGAKFLIRNGKVI